MYWGFATLRILIHRESWLVLLRLCQQSKIYIIYDPCRECDQVVGAVWAIAASLGSRLGSVTPGLRFVLTAAEALDIHMGRRIDSEGHPGQGDHERWLKNPGEKSSLLVSNPKP